MKRQFAAIGILLAVILASCGESAERQIKLRCGFLYLERIDGI